MAENGKPTTLYTLELSDAQAAKLRDLLMRRGWGERVVPYTQYAFEGNKVQVTVYEKKNKLVVQGKGAEDFVQNVLEPEVTGVAKMGYDEVHHPDWFELHAGCDEAGKGDLFGPLVTACVIADEVAIRSFIKAGVKDSKRLGDPVILKLEAIIRNTPGVAVATAACGMEKYNELMAKPNANLNRLLAWLHSKSLGEALNKKSAPWGLLDQFATHDQVDYYLARPDFELRRRTKAESDPVVAAASIVARAGFVRAIDDLSKKIGRTLPKGASKETQLLLKSLRGDIGVEGLAAYAKLHFKLRAIGEAPPKED